MTTILDLYGSGLETFAADLSTEREASFSGGVRLGKTSRSERGSTPVSGDINPDAILSAEEITAIEAMFERWRGAPIAEEGALQ